MRDSKLWVITAVFFALSAFADSQMQLVKENRSELQLDAGGDMRARYEFKDNWMSSGKNTIGTAYEDYLRFRTRLWGEVEYQEKHKLFLRLGNEFRDYSNSTKNKNRNEFPDEIYIENLYFDLKEIADRFSLRVGRQDIILGAGRLVKDGTPGDGSRSIYFDALRATVDLMEQSTLDLIGIYNYYRDNATIGNGHDLYDMTYIKSGSPYSKMDEMALVAYFSYNEIEDFPMEFYYIWKQETRFYDKTTRYPGRNFHTLGTRLNPHFTEKFSGELESAVQSGEVDSQGKMQEREIMAWMTYTALTYSEKELSGKPQGSLALLYLSGDEDSYYKTTDGSTDHGWNPVFNRSSWFSEICASMYDKYRWSNLIYPHLQAGIEPYHKHTVQARSGPMFAAAKDNNANSSYRGYFSKVNYQFPLLSEIYGGRGALKGAIVWEVLYYGGYYEQEPGDSKADFASWLRFEIKGEF
ncbi:MAG: alginate export family protein [Kiritimatiellae bacterium]|nr:alginate export family protein [Kiritimatiellia bacterium]